MAWLSASNSARMPSTMEATSFFRESGAIGAPRRLRAVIIDRRQRLCEGPAMTQFAAAPDGIRIAYDDLGQGLPVVLIHGFGASRAQNWKAPGWYDTLLDAGFRVVAPDCRGHGESGKPHDVAAYDEGKMTGDVVTVMKAAGLSAAFLMGYSMGGYMTLRLLNDHPRLFPRAVVAGVGDVYFRRSMEWRVMIADAILAPPDAGLKTPALVVCGGEDRVSGPPGPLAEALGHARAVTVPGRDHMLTVGDKVYKKAVLEFFAE